MVTQFDENPQPIAGGGNDILSETTEIHIVARAHGPIAPDTATFLDQTGSFEGE